MDLIEKLQDISTRISKLKENVNTEEATKNAFVMPFLSALGYDIFNPMEVVPEFTADLATKKGEKVDYCILQDNNPIIIVECKHWKEDLDVHTSQLERYFHVTTTKFGILTNGIKYRFYTDLEELNKLDKKPFFEFSFEDVNENTAQELKKFTKDNFDVDKIFSAASDLKYSRGIKELLTKELTGNPSKDFVKLIASKIYDGNVTIKIQEQFEVLVKKSSKQLISDLVSERLKTALTSEKEDTKTDIAEANAKLEKMESDNDGIVTTEEELEGFKIIQAIVRKSVPLDRIFMRDTKSYCGVLLDDNNRKAICRMWFNGGKKYIGIFDEEKKETKHLISCLEDIYNLDEMILKTVESHLEK